MIKTFKSTIFSALLICGIAQANKQTTPTDLADSLVWEINGPELQAPSYLVGTMHIMCEKDFAIDPRIHQAMNQATQLYLEIDFDDPKEMQFMQQAMYVKKPLKERLTAAQYDQLAEVISKHTTFEIKAFENTSLFGIQSAILFSSLKCPVKKMLDIELMQLAQSKSLPIHGLESTKYQLEVMEKAFPLNDKIMTEEELEVFYNIGDVFDQMVQTYLSEDIDKMKQTFAEQMSMMDNSAAAIKLMLDVRNQNWVEKIPAIAEQQVTVFAFGAGHLAGEQGVINLLRESGLTVKPIMD